MPSGTCHSLFAISAVNPQLIYAAGSGGVVVKYNGDSWTKILDLPIGQQIEDILAFAEDNLWSGTGEPAPPCHTGRWGAWMADLAFDYLKQAPNLNPDFKQVVNWGSCGGASGAVFYSHTRDFIDVLALDSLPADLTTAGLVGLYIMPPTEDLIGGAPWDNPQEWLRFDLYNNIVNQGFRKDVVWIASQRDRVSPFASHERYHQALLDPMYYDQVINRSVIVDVNHDGKWNLGHGQSFNITYCHFLNLYFFEGWRFWILEGERSRGGIVIGSRPSNDNGTTTENTDDMSQDAYWEAQPSDGNGIMYNSGDIDYLEQGMRYQAVFWFFNQGLSGSDMATIKILAGNNPEPIAQRSFSHSSVLLRMKVVAVSFIKDFTEPDRIMVHYHGVNKCGLDALVIVEHPDGAWNTEMIINRY